MTQQEVTGWVSEQLAPHQESAQLKEVLLVLLLLDDSGSIEGAGNTQAVIDGHNGFVEALRGAVGEVRLKTMFLNRAVEKPFQHPDAVELLSRQTYRPDGGTPLFLRSLEALEQIDVVARELSVQGITTRTMSFIFTDGGDNGSGIITSAHVKPTVDALLLAGTNIVGGCAVSDGGTNFWRVFASMGIPEHWIRVLRNDPRHVRDNLTTMGTMASGASTGPESFTRTSQTGFGPPKK